MPIAERPSPVLEKPVPQSDETAYVTLNLDNPRKFSPLTVPHATLREGVSPNKQMSRSSSGSHQPPEGRGSPLIKQLSKTSFDQTQHSSPRTSSPSVRVADTQQPVPLSPSHAQVAAVLAESITPGSPRGSRHFLSELIEAAHSPVDSPRSARVVMSLAEASQIVGSPKSPRDRSVSNLTESPLFHHHENTSPRNSHPLIAVEGPGSRASKSPRSFSGNISQAISFNTAEERSSPFRQMKSSPTLPTGYGTPTRRSNSQLASQSATASPSKGSPIIGSAKHTPIPAKNVLVVPTGMMTAYTNSMAGSPMHSIDIHQSDMFSIINGDDDDDDAPSEASNTIEFI